MNDEFESDLPSEKYWITKLNTSSVKSQYEIKFTLINQPENEDEIKKWLRSTFGPGGYIYRLVGGYFYVEMFFRNESDATMFILMWGDSFV